MVTRRSTTVYLWELAWILPSFAIPVGMLAALAVTAFGAGINVTGNQGRIDPVGGGLKGLDRQMPHLLIVRLNGGLQGEATLILWRRS